MTAWEIVDAFAATAEVVPVVWTVRGRRCDPRRDVMWSFRPHPWRGEWQPGCVPVSRCPSVRTHRRQRQPYVDGELRLTAEALSRHRLPTLWRLRRQMRTPVAAARSPLRHRQAHEVVRSRSRLQPAGEYRWRPSIERSASIGLMTLHLNRS